MKNLKTVNHSIYDNYFFRDVAGHEEYYVFSRAKRLINGCFENKCGKVLDVGFGRGEMLIYLHDLGWSGTGIDCSEAAILKASEKIGTRNIVLKQMPVTSLNLPPAHYDLVLFLNVWEHLNSEEVSVFLRDLKKYLKSGGHLIIQTSPTRWQAGFGKMLLRLAGLRPASEQWHINEQTVSSLKKSLSSAGFAGDVWLERMPKFWSSQVGQERGVLFQATSILDFLLDKTIFGLVADRFPLKLFFGTDIWAVVHPSAAAK